MYRYCFLILLFCYSISCEECVTYDFEDNGISNFSNTYGICDRLVKWDIGQYAELNLESPHEQSTTFISPRSTLSCLSSFKFPITGSGTLEVNVYMKPSASTDQVTVLVFQSLPDRPDATAGMSVLTPNDNMFEPGWQTMRIQVIGIGTHEGYISLLGMAAPTSIVIVDSFRYVGPSSDIDLCKIYTDVETTIIVPTTTIPPPTPTITPTTTVSSPPTATTSKPTYITTASTTVTPSTTPVTESPITSTQRPRLSISILLIKIQKFFR